MNQLNLSFYVVFLLHITLIGCGRKDNLHAQKANSVVQSDKIVGGRCEGCELYNVDMPSDLTWHTTVNTPDEMGEKLIIEGYLYQKDGISPASNVIMYLYQTTNEGLYTSAVSQKGEVRRHGRLRGWVKTRADGFYTFSTIRPAPYPNADIPAHIHPTIKEVGKTAYYIDDYVFEDDVFVTETYRKKQELRCGSGIIALKKDSSGTWHGKRNLIVGLNIPNY